MATHADGVPLGHDFYRMPPQIRNPDPRDVPQDVSHVKPLKRMLKFGMVGAFGGLVFAVPMLVKQGYGKQSFKYRYPASIQRWAVNNTRHCMAAGFTLMGTIGLGSGVFALIRQRDDRTNIKIGMMLSWAPTALILQSPGVATKLLAGLVGVYFFLRQPHYDMPIYKPRTGIPPWEHDHQADFEPTYAGTSSKHLFTRFQKYFPPPDELQQEYEAFKDKMALWRDWQGPYYPRERHDQVEDADADADSAKDSESSASDDSA